MITYGRIYKMKKLLMIIVLGLLLSSCARISNETQKAYIESDYIKIGMEFSEFKKLFKKLGYPMLGWKPLNIHNTYPKYMHSGTAISSHVFVYT